MFNYEEGSLVSGCTDELMFVLGDNNEDEDCKGGVNSRELDTCFPLHFGVGKESLEVLGRT